jgi:hypothetical protein
MCLAVAAIALVVASCGGGGESAPLGAPGVNQTGTSNARLVAPPIGGGNTLAITVDAGPVANAPDINVGFVTVVVCPPGTPAATVACQTVDHVVLDTGSSGLRLLQSVLSVNLTLPPAISGAQAIGECGQFADGFVWGSVRMADVYLAGEIARSVPLQDIGDLPGGATGVPGDCSASGGLNESSLAVLGANGILGVGLFRTDCDVCATSVQPGTYYNCNPMGCSGTAVAAAQLVANPVWLFSADNNGVVIRFPTTVPAAGVASLSGSLTFGIGTQSNNVLGVAVVYPADSSGNLTTSFNGTTFTVSFIDSGTNALFFPDASIPACPPSGAAGFYCPLAPVSLAATIQGAGGAPTSPPVSFSIVNAQALAGNIVAANLGGPQSGAFGWGLPFFFGRTVFVAIDGLGTPAGPYWAF